MFTRKIPDPRPNAPDNHRYEMGGPTCDGCGRWCPPFHYQVIEGPGAGGHFCQVTCTQDRMHLTPIGAARENERVMARRERHKERLDRWRRDGAGSGQPPQDSWRRS